MDLMTLIIGTVWELLEETKMFSFPLFLQVQHQTLLKGKIGSTRLAQEILDGPLFYLEMMTALPQTGKGIRIILISGLLLVVTTT